MGILLVLIIFFSLVAQALPLDYGEELTPQARLQYDTVVDVIPLDDMRAAMSNVWQHGMNSKLYWTDEMEKTYFRGADQRARMKKRVNQNFLRLLSDISVGSVDPESLARDVKFKRKKFLSPKQLQAVIVSTGRKADLLVDTMAPQNSPYVSLRTTFLKVFPACQNGQWMPLVKTKKVLKLGVKDTAVSSLKDRLAFLGYAISNQDDVFDQEVVNAVNDIEWNMHLKPDGTIRPGGSVWKFLNVTCMERVRQLQADMEKMRWFPSQFEDRYIFINLAMTYFVLVDKTQNPAYITSFRTINGRAARKSPTMQDKIVRVILNPAWVVPPTIFIEDKVTEIRNLPRHQIQYYFDSHNYEVWNKEFSRRLNPATIDWWSYDSGLDADVYIRQKPNYWNALGVVKFELTNSFSVYLHDTNQRELFWEPQRLLSSGCIRLEKPFDLAEYLLRGTSWTREKIESSTLKPGEVSDKSTRIELANPIPVYTVFLTSFLSSDNIIRFTDDVYGQNADILTQLKGF
jgi:L,D-transpeptidase YcbB